MKRARSLRALRQEALLVLELAGQVFLKHEVQAPLGQGLLLGAHAHLQHLVECLFPGGVRLEEGVVLERVFGALDVDRLERVRCVFEFEVEDVLGGDAQELRLGDAEEAVDVGRVARSDLQRAVDVRDAVGVAVDEAVGGQLLFFREAAHEAPLGPGRHPAHRDQNAVGLAPILVVVEPRKHASGFDGQDELGLGFELEVFHRGGDGVGPRPHGRAVDADLFPGVAVPVDDGQFAGQSPAVFFRAIAQLFASEALEASQGLDVVHDRVGLGLLVEFGLVPVLRDVVGLSLRREVVVFDHLFREGHEA